MTYHETNYISATKKIKIQLEFLLSRYFFSFASASCETEYYQHSIYVSIDLMCELFTRCRWYLSVNLRNESTSRTSLWKYTFFRSASFARSCNYSAFVIFTAAMLVPELRKRPVLRARWVPCRWNIVYTTVIYPIVPPRAIIWTWRASSPRLVPSWRSLCVRWVLKERWLSGRYAYSSWIFSEPPTL